MCVLPQVFTIMLLDTHAHLSLIETAGGGANEADDEFIKNEVRSFLGEDSEDRGKPSNALVDTMQSRRFK